MITITDCEDYVSGVCPPGRYDWDGEGSAEGFAAWIFYALGKIPDDDGAEEACDQYVRATLWCDGCGEEIMAPGYAQHCTEGDFCGDRCLDRRCREILGR